MRWDVGFAVLLAVAAASVGRAQTVQLPSFSNFSVDTTVIVPDRGAVSLGGSSRAATGANHVNGIPRQRAIGLNQQAAGQRVLTEIHDPREADAALLGQAGANRRANSAAAARSAMARASADPGLASVAELNQGRLEARSSAAREAQAAFKKGRQAETEGKNSVAAVYYRLAAKQADAELRKVIDARLRSLAAGASAAARAPKATAAAR